MPLGCSPSHHHFLLLWRRNTEGNIFVLTTHAMAPNQYMEQRDWKSGTEGNGNAGAKSSGTAKYTRTYKSAVQSSVDRFASPPSL
jgi:hypothetical protein